MEKLENTRIQGIAGDVGGFVYANMFNSDVVEEYHNDEIELSDFLEENIEEIIEQLLGEGLIYKEEYEILMKDEDYIQNELVSYTVPFLKAEIEVDMMEYWK